MCQVEVQSPERNFATNPNLNVDVIDVPLQKCHRLSLAHCKATHIGRALALLMSASFVKHNVVVNVCYCQHLDNQSGSQATY